MIYTNVLKNKTKHLNNFKIDVPVYILLQQTKYVYTHT